MSPFEALMLLCFGAAWPFSIHTSYVSRSTRGKSLLFLLVLLIGYTSGIIHKLFYARDPVLLLYILNWTMVGIDTLLYLRNRRMEREALRRASR
ncbi:hypothetical protein Spith_0578 [Spirochaeta thermophila DSM 6578]|uniref:Uncharacterized protein n=1 Tax=Winmispira thermophila (strain ATCC 700085 / DSM 6578 / Z-1203) TaxID=869211 RepID=G0G9V8_WINT7|nr:hypothetical protein [Spirochaeta thermophila]AEJ60858.1 hypothetical protein Spith_0578 [Spirochaeta thermophila DSM 6578]